MAGLPSAINLTETMMRILHTMLRVGDLERSIAFYTDVLGMKELRRNEYPEGKFTLAFLGYQSEAESAVLELTYNWGVANTSWVQPTAISPSRWRAPLKPVSGCVAKAGWS